MTINLTSLITVTAGGQQTINSNGNFNTDAVEVLNFMLQPGVTDEEILIQPGPASDVMLLALQAETGDDSISYKTAIGAPNIVLKGAHVYNGPTMVALLGATPTRLYFSSSNPNPFTVIILVGRNP